MGELYARFSPLLLLSVFIDALLPDILVSIHITPSHSLSVSASLFSFPLPPSFVFCPSLTLLGALMLTSIHLSRKDGWCTV